MSHQHPPPSRSQHEDVELVNIHHSSRIEMHLKKEHARRSSIATSQIEHSSNTATAPNQGKEPISSLIEDTKSEMESCGIGPDSSLQPGQSTITGIKQQQTGIIARLCRFALESLAFLIQSSVLTTTAKDKRILRRCHATLKLWTDGHHIWAGELDSALEGSENLKHTTLSVLHSLCVPLLLGLKTHLESSPDDAVAAQLLRATANTCRYVRLWLSNFDRPTSDTDSSDDDVYEDGHGENETNGLAEKIKMYTHCLLDLSAALECPAPDAEPNYRSFTANEPLEAPTSMSVTEPTGVATQMRPAPRLKGMVLTLIEFMRWTSGFSCPFRQAQKKLGLPYTCTAKPAITMSAVRTHLTRDLPKGTPPHLPFLKLCTTCNEDILDDVEFETRHGVDGMKCETPRPQRKGATGQHEQYDLLCSKVEAYIAAQKNQRAPAATHLDIAPGPPMTSHAEYEVAKEHSSLSDRDHLSMHSKMVTKESWNPRQNYRRSVTQWTSDSGKANDSDFSDFRLTSEQGPLSTPNHEWEIPEFQVPGGFFEALEDDELGNERHDGTLIPDIGRSRHLSEPGTTKRQPEIGPTSSSTVPKSLPCDVEGCDARFFVGMDEELARKHHNHRFHQKLHSDQSQIRRSHSPRVKGGKDGHLSETEDFW